MNEEQLDALLDFYKSDMGRSILEAHKIIGAEIRDRFQESVSISTASKDGAFWMTGNPGNPGNPGKHDT